MKIEKIVVGKFAVNCFLVVCEETKEAIVVDPGEQAHLIERAIKAGFAAPRINGYDGGLTTG